MGFEVAGETAVVHEPAGGPLDHPSPGGHLEAFGARVALDDFAVDAEAGAVVDHLCGVSGVGPCFGACAGDLGEQVDAVGIVGDADRAHLDCGEQSEGVDT